MSETDTAAPEPQAALETILVVDDEVEVLRAIQRELAYWLAEHRVRLLAAGSAAEALEILAGTSDAVSLVISDLRMPGMAGSDLLLRIHEQHPDIMLILLTAFNDMPEIRKAVSATLHALILKPWDTDTLIAEIEKALDTHRRQRASRRRTQEIAEQLQMAGQFQKVLLQTRIPETQRIRVDVTCLPASNLHLGGDYYDWIEIGKDRHMLLVGDVSGHGVKPALITAMLKVLIAEILRDSGDTSAPARLLTLLNNRICRELAYAPEVVITLAALLFDLPGGVLRLANAGHLPVYLLRGGQCLAFRVAGTAMGFTADLDYAQEEVPLEPGDVIVLFSDGFVDRGPGREPLAEPALMQILLRAERGPSFNREVLLLAGSGARPGGEVDDTTLVSVHLKR